METPPPPEEFDGDVVSRKVPPATTMDEVPETSGEDVLIVIVPALVALPNVIVPAPLSVSALKFKVWPVATATEVVPPEDSRPLNDKPVSEMKLPVPLSSILTFEFSELVAPMISEPCVTLATLLNVLAPVSVTEPLPICEILLPEI